MQTKKRTILITAYSVNPYKGSEDGTGWNIPLHLATTNSVIVITRKNNRPEIERFYRENKKMDDLKNLKFYYFDLPMWLVFWKKKIGERGYVLYFYLWQFFMPWYIKMVGLHFDVLHALNFHSDSQPQFLWILKKPVFWGPIGHHAKVPREFILKEYSKKLYFKDRLYNGVKFIFRTFDPFYYLSKWTAKKIFVINSQINKSVKANPSKVIQLPAVATSIEKYDQKKTDHFNILSVGRFAFMKGFDVVIKSFAVFYTTLTPSQKNGVKLTLVGKGEELSNLKRIIQTNNIQDAVDIIPWVEKSEMLGLYQKASVFSFGSHEGAGMVIPEALSNGIPVVCFNNQGPGELCTSENAIKIEVGRYDQAIQDFATAFKTLFNNPTLQEKLGSEARKYASKYFSWEYKSNVINQAYDELDGHKKDQ